MLSVDRLRFTTMMYLYPIYFRSDDTGERCYRHCRYVSLIPPLSLTHPSLTSHHVLSIILCSIWDAYRLFCKSNDCVLFVDKKWANSLYSARMHLISHGKDRAHNLWLTKVPRYPYNHHGRHWYIYTVHRNKPTLWIYRATVS